MSTLKPEISELPLPAPETEIPPAKLKRSWRFATAGSMIGMGYFSFCLLETPRIKFLDALGASPRDFGLLAGLAGAAIGFQLLSGILVNLLPRRKPYWIVACIAYRLLFALILAAPLLFTGSRACIAFILSIQFLHDALLHVTGPAWQSWMADLLPRDRVRRMWGLRLQWVTSGQLLASLISAAAMHYYESRGEIVHGFTVMACVGIFCGVVDILLYLFVPEPSHQRNPGLTIIQSLFEPLTDRHFRPYLNFMIYWNFAAMLAGPFFLVYLVKSVRMPGYLCQLTVCSTLLGQAIGARLLARFADRHGPAKSLQAFLLLKLVSISPMMLIPPTPVYYWLFPATWWFDGFLNGGIVVVLQAALYRSSPRTNRTMYIGMTQFLAVGLAGGVAPFCAGIMIDHLAGWSVPVGVYSLNAYHLIFAISLLLRMPSVLLAGRISDRARVYDANTETQSVQRELASSRKKLAGEQLAK